MITNPLRAATAIALVLLASSSLAQAQQVPTIAADIKSTPPGTIMTKEYVSMVGRLAYIWGWPMVNQINRRAAFSKAPEPGLLGGVLPAAPVGYISMLTDYIKPEQRFVTCPNQDTVYGAGFFKLDTQPVVVQVPDFGDRFFTYQIVDHRTDSFASIGKQYGTKPGFYLLVGPNWKGDVPAGITATLTELLSPYVFTVYKTRAREEHFAVGPSANMLVRHNTAWVSHNTRAHAKPPGTRLGLEKRFL